MANEHIWYIPACFKDKSYHMCRFQIESRMLKGSEKLNSVAQNLTGENGIKIIYFIVQVSTRLECLNGPYNQSIPLYLSVLSWLELGNILFSNWYSHYYVKMGYYYDIRTSSISGV